MNTIERKFHLLTKENYPRIVALLRSLAKARRFLLLKRALHALHPTSLALLWDSFDESEREIILSQLSSDYAAEFLTELGSDERSAIFRSKDTGWIFDRLEELETDDIAGILRDLSPRDTNFILRRFDKNYTGKIKEILDVKTIREQENWDRHAKIEDVMDLESFVHLRTRIRKSLREEHAGTDH
mgnify:CR=1 FL=1